jgi:uncharacterized OsmC-like protein
MKLILETETSNRLEMGGTGFEIVSEAAPISPYHLLAASLSSCTVLTLQSWAEGAGVDLAPLTVAVSWDKADERPARIERIAMELRWPGLPEDRVETAERVADLCPIHATLTRGTQIERRVLALPLGG